MIHESCTRDLFRPHFKALSRKRDSCSFQLTSDVGGNGRVIFKDAYWLHLPERQPQNTQPSKHSVSPAHRPLSLIEKVDLRLEPCHGSATKSKERWPSMDNPEDETRSAGTQTYLGGVMACRFSRQPCPGHEIQVMQPCCWTHRSHLPATCP